MYLESFPSIGSKDTSLRQKVGIPMGGKASSELVNVYCYAVESQFMNALVSSGRLKEARIWSLTWRYTDDLLGFSERTWHQLPCGMEHRDTSLKANVEAGFLGLHN